METLGELADGATVTVALMPLVKQYRGWIETQSAVVVGMKGTRSEMTLGIHAAGS